MQNEKSASTGTNENLSQATLMICNKSSKKSEINQSINHGSCGMIVQFDISQSIVVHHLVIDCCPLFGRY